MKIMSELALEAELWSNIRIGLAAIWHSFFDGIYCKKSDELCIARQDYVKHDPTNETNTRGQSTLECGA